MAQQLVLQNTLTASLQRCKTPGYDTKQSDGEAPIMLQLREMWSTPSFTSLPDPLWPGAAALKWVLSIGRNELNSEIMLN